MKHQVLKQKISVFIFAVLSFIYGIQGIAYVGLEFIEGETTTREIEENSAAGTNIGTPLKFTKEGVNGCLHFRFHGTDANAFRLQWNYGVQLKTKSALDYETKDTYEVKITVSDGGDSDTICVTINVTDVEEIQPNRPPVFASDSTTRFVFEDTPPNQSIINPVTATDPDVDTLTYNLSGTDAESFDIDSSSGQLKTKAELDHETKSQYMVTGEVSDGKGGTDTIDVTINVTTLDRPDVIMFLRQNGVTESDQTVKPGEFELVMDFGQPMTGFEQSELNINDFETNATITGWQRSTNEEDYIATVSAPEIGGVTFTVPANAAHAADDGQGNIETKLTVFVRVSGEFEEGNSGASSGRTQTPQSNEKFLFANYPNPFNPETWIPYHLAEASHVEINIYNMRGTVVRHLDLGDQQAGYHTNRNEAAYWDGKNDFGKRVASGTYFYQLQADNVSPMRKMVILK